MNRLVQMIEEQAIRYSSREAFRFSRIPEGEWLSVSWQDFKKQIDTAAKAFAALGLQEKDAIAVCSQNAPQILIAEFGAFNNRLVAIPIYSGSSQDQFDFIVSNGEARIILVGDKYQYDLAYGYWKKHPGSIKKIIGFFTEEEDRQDDDKISISWEEFLKIGIEATPEIAEKVKRRIANGLPDDPATLIYTSGTTGEPKGVVISHANYDAAMEIHLKTLTMVSDEDLSMAFLPMSHILEKAWSFFCLTKGIKIAINYDPRLIQDTIHKVHPNVMCCVPRFWEKVYAGVKEKIASMSSFQRMIIKRALKVGKKRNLHYARLGLKTPTLLEKEYQFWDRRIFSRLKNAIGIPEPNMFPTAGAPLSDRICEFMRSVGIDVKIGYGLSETTATVSCFGESHYTIGTVGKPLSGIEVKISPEGEILVKAPTVTPGYFKNPKANEEAFTSDGFFRTGDAGYLTADGSLVLTERVKDLFKTSNGKYIAPQALESRLAENKYIDEVAVIGDQRKFVTALVVPNLSQIKAWASREGINYESIESLLADPRTNKLIMKQIDETQKDMASYERIKRITLLPNHFSVMNGEVTNTMKVRRPVVAKRYAREIEAMYAE